VILINARKHIKVKLWHLIIIAALSVVARVILLGDYIGHDDAYIYLRYAKNISAGHGWSFNPGEPSYGTTSPLWTLILVFGNVLGFGAWLFALNRLVRRFRWFVNILLCVKSSLKCSEILLKMGQ